MDLNMILVIIYAPVVGCASLRVMRVCSFSDQGLPCRGNRI